jgi:hypothetical protein
LFFAVAFPGVYTCTTPYEEERTLGVFSAEQSPLSDAVIISKIFNVVLFFAVNPVLARGVAPP